MTVLDIKDYIQIRRFVFTDLFYTKIIHLLNISFIMFDMYKPFFVYLNSTGLKCFGRQINVFSLLQRD